jgi:hypothetical protein
LEESDVLGEEVVARIGQLAFAADAEALAGGRAVEHVQLAGTEPSHL